MLACSRWASSFATGLEDPDVDLGRRRGDGNGMACVRIACKSDGGHPSKRVANNSTVVRCFRSARTISWTCMEHPFRPKTGTPGSAQMYAILIIRRPGAFRSGVLRLSERLRAG